jgi:hypothetical protein
MKSKDLSKHVPPSGGEDAVDDVAPRKRRRSRSKAIAAVATAASVLVVPAMADADVSAVNQERTAAGLPPVYEDGGLTALAQQKSAQMAATGNLVHTGDLGGTVGSVLPSFTGAAENIGQGQSVATVTSSFMGSPTHRSAILGNFSTAGVGVTVGGDGRVWVAQLFARTGAGAPAAVAPSRAAPGAATRSGRRCRRQTRRVIRRIGGRRVARIVQTQRCTKAKRKAAKRSVRRRARAHRR